MGRLPQTLGVTSSTPQRIHVRQSQMQAQRSSETLAHLNMIKTQGIAPNPASSGYRSQRQGIAVRLQLNDTSKCNFVGILAVAQKQNTGATVASGSLRQCKIQMRGVVASVSIANQYGHVQGVAGNSQHSPVATPNPSFNRTHCGVPAFGL